MPSSLVVHDRDAAQDLTSDVFHKALANLSRFEWRGVPFAAWLLLIAANAITALPTRTAREDPSPDDPLEPSSDMDMTEVDHRQQLIRFAQQRPPEQRP